MLQTHYRSSLDFSDSRLDETIHAYNRLANLLRNLRWARDLAVCGLGRARRGARRTPRRHRGDAGEVRARDGRRLQHRRRARRGLRAREGSQHVPRRVPGRPVRGRPPRAARGRGPRRIASQRARHRDLARPDLLLPASRSSISRASWRAIRPPTPTVLWARCSATRAAARASKDFARADAVRDGLAGFGFQIEDTPQGARVIYRSQE